MQLAAKMAGQYQPHIVNYNEDEESTCISMIVMVRFSYFKAIILTPLLSLLTVFVLPIFMYWNVKVRAAMLYSPVTKLEEATAMEVHNRHTGAIEICQLERK